MSFSIWFYYLVGRAILLVQIWAGYGDNILAFPSDYLGATNSVTSLGAGGIFVFSAICLFRCIRDYARLVAGKSLGRRIVVALPVVGLIGFTAMAVCWLAWNHTPVIWALIFVACLTLLTLGLMRVVAESGIYWFQTHTGFFHIYKVFGLGKFLAPILVAPLLPIYSVLFLDNKTFLAPNLLNAAQMQKNSRADRWKFHINLVVCLVLSVAVTLPACIFLAHLRSAAAMENWFYNSSSAWMLDSAQHTIATLPAFNMKQAALLHRRWSVGDPVGVAANPDLLVPPPHRLRDAHEPSDCIYLVQFFSGVDVQMDGHSLWRQGDLRSHPRHLHWFGRRAIVGDFVLGSVRATEQYEHHRLHVEHVVDVT